MKRYIRLRGINGQVEGKTWESTSVLRAGRLETLEIVLDDGSVSRRHAEIRGTDHGWRLRDLQSTNGTFLNGNKVSSGEWPIRAHDIISCGNVTFVVDDVQENREEGSSGPEQIVVEAATCNTWEEAINGLAFNRNRGPRPGEQLLALVRAGHHLVHMEREEDLLHSILNDAVGALDAQRGAIVLADGPENRLRLRALATGRNEKGGRHSFSQHLAQRSFNQGESILCHKVDEDPELAMAQSISEGAMASVLCVLLRTPRRRLGVLHLDRSPFQKPFTQDDLFLADALAANVSAGIECAQLLRKQRDFFLNTITTLAQAVEQRDAYTGGHTTRVTLFSLELAKELELSEDKLNLIRIGTPLHDIGKIGIDDAILKKPGRLTPEEFEIMKTHTVKGAEILSIIPEMKDVIPIARFHHERWDGKGYPDLLSGENIPEIARIVAVADAFDAMTSDRPYRKGMAPDIAFTEIRKFAGTQFDPKCATTFVSANLRNKILQSMNENSSDISTIVKESRRVS